MAATDGQDHRSLACGRFDRRVGPPVRRGVERALASAGRRREHPGGGRPAGRPGIRQSQRSAHASLFFRRPDLDQPVPAREAPVRAARPGTDRHVERQLPRHCRVVEAAGRVTRGTGRARPLATDEAQLGGDAGPAILLARQLAEEHGHGDGPCRLSQFQSGAHRPRRGPPRRGGHRPDAGPATAAGRQGARACGHEQDPLAGRAGDSHRVRGGLPATHVRRRDGILRMQKHAGRASRSHRRRCPHRLRESRAAAAPVEAGNRRARQHARRIRRRDRAAASPPTALSSWAMRSAAPGR
jgi:hypothetical protein